MGVADRDGPFGRFRARVGRFIGRPIVTSFSFSRVPRILPFMALVVGGHHAATFAEPIPPFVAHTLNRSSQFSACAVFDVDKDGQTDIFCGGFWYAGPRWDRYATRAVPNIRGRYDDYSNLPMDVNGDGWTDVISVNYRSRALYWVENPGGWSGPGRALNSAGRWKTHQIDMPGASETGILADVDADGSLDVLPNGVQFSAWYQLDRAAPSPRWVSRELPAEVAGHGIGFGDIDGDDRGDIVSPRGWWKFADRWQWRPEFQLHRDGSIPILVLDVDRDGDADVVWGRGHNVGLYWLEQRQANVASKPQETGVKTRQWVFHVIDTSWSCAHCLLAGDLDGDGHAEVIAGKRLLGHDGRDPGEIDPLRISAYQFDPDRRVWRSRVLSFGGNVGIDLGGACGDLDGDGDVDIVAPTRGGLSWLENQRIGPSTADTKSPRHATIPLPGMQCAPYVKSGPLVPDDTSQGAAAATGTWPPTALRRWGERRCSFRAAVEQVVGSLPDSASRVPLDVQVLGREQADGYTRIHLTYAADAISRVPAYLLVPDSLERPAPAMLCLHPTSPLGKAQICGLGGKPSRFYAHELAQRGFVCLAPDYPSFGEYEFDFVRHSQRYPSGTLKAIWDNIRAIDLLESMPEVDRDQIGCIGHSLGGHNGLFTAAFDLRIRMVVTSCGFNSFHDYYGGDLRGWSSDRYMPRIRTQFGLDPKRVPFDFDAILALVAPRSVFVNAPLHDDNFALVGVERSIESSRRAWELFPGGGTLRVVHPDCGHDFPAETRQQVYAWLAELTRKGK